MASLNVHAAVAMSASGLAATSFMVGDLASTRDVILYFAMGSVGGLLPDLDLDNSKALRTGFFLLSLLAAFAVIFCLASQFSLLELVLVWLTVFVAVRYGLYWVFTHLTVHRGMFHSIPAAALVGLTTASVMYHGLSIDTFTAWIAGLFITFGYLLHLLLDEFYSVDFYGVTLKRSFGTALKVFSFRSWRTSLILYAAVGLAYYTAPEMRQLSTVMLHEQAYRGILTNLVPSNGWFVYGQTSWGKDP